MADAPVPLGSITPGVGACWLVDICHEDGPVGEAWREAYTSIRQAKGDVIRAYDSERWTILFSRTATRSWVVLAVPDA